MNNEAINKKYDNMIKNIYAQLLEGVIQDMVKNFGLTKIALILITAINFALRSSVYAEINDATEKS